MSYPLFYREHLKEAKKIVVGWGSLWGIGVNLSQKQPARQGLTAVSSAMQYILIPLNPPIEGGLSLSPPSQGGLGGI